jgi:uncharacterized repeat protein (TIGR03806 family)
MIGVRAVAATALVLAGVGAFCAPLSAKAGTPGGRPAAEPFLGLPETADLAAAGEWAVEQAYPHLGFANPVFIIAEPGSERLWVLEQQGRILSFVDDADSDEACVVLDLRAITRGFGDSGLLSMAFHPDYADESSPSQGLIFAAYAFRDPNLAKPPLQFRVSRFFVDRTTGIADPESERVLIDQLDQNVWHQGAAMLFRPSDGYLYVTVGDEGGIGCGFNNCQRIDRDLFSGVLRIDVDALDDRSHPPPRQPETGTTAHYAIPNDNPFVGVPGALEEFYALGLRSPHRMTLDPVDDLVWIGDVGQNTREEIDVLAPGANFQWNILEGTVPLDGQTEPPDPLIGVWTPPIIDYGRENQDATVIGGYVYRGSDHPELVGRYVYGDFLSGRIWALTYQKNGDRVRAVENEELVRTPFRGRTNGLVSFGLDTRGEILVLTLGESARIYRLVASENDARGVPPTLSTTGLFENLQTLTPVEALVPYDVRVPLWSDAAGKRRWMSVPSSEVIAYSPTEPWRFPPGTVFVKHFEMQMDARDPDSWSRLETRILVVQPNSRVYGATYRWREDGLDADLLTRGEVDLLTVRDADGVPHERDYEYPGPGDCLTCHNENAGFVLGPRARQLTDEAGSPDDDQLQWLAAVGFLDVAEDGLERSAVPSFAGLGEESAPLELRVRSYLDVNCSHCHGSQALDRSVWDARITTPYNRQRIIYGTPVGDYGADDVLLVAPGAPDDSLLWRRTSTTQLGLRMPPLARNAVDDAFVSMLTDWISELPAEPPPPPMCGDAAAPFDTILARDALRILRGALDLLNEGSCWDCICDANGDGDVSVSDALLVLRRAIDPGVMLSCTTCF